MLNKTAVLVTTQQVKDLDPSKHVPSEMWKAMTHAQKSEFLRRKESKEQRESDPPSKAPAAATKDKCFRCGKRGHFAASCEETLDTKYCAICDDNVGHTMAQCPSKYAQSMRACLAMAPEDVDDTALLCCLADAHTSLDEVEADLLRNELRERDGPTCAALTWANAEDIGLGGFEA